MYEEGAHSVPPTNQETQNETLIPIRHHGLPHDGHHHR